MNRNTKKGVSPFPFLIGKVLTYRRNKKNFLLSANRFPFLIGKVLTDGGRQS